MTVLGASGIVNGFIPVQCPKEWPRPGCSPVVPRTCRERSRTAKLEYHDGSIGLKNNLQHGVLDLIPDGAMN